MKAYYNEFDKYPAQWLRNLIDAGLIMPGDVDERSIEDVTPTDLAGYDRCHFFAGIAGWERALQLAGWPAKWPVWTGSCPCQPFSTAGKGGRGTDERHLWPAWFHLIRVCRPPVIFGEQVASKDGLKWLDLVCSDLEAEGYAVGAADLCAAGCGAPHIRQRLWFVAYSEMSERRWSGNQENLGRGIEEIGGSSPTGLMADSIGSRFSGGDQRGLGESGREMGEQEDRKGIADQPGNRCQDANFWSSCQWLPCRDGKWRPTGFMDDSLYPLPSRRKPSRKSKQVNKRQTGRFEPSSSILEITRESRAVESIIQPLAHGVPARVGRLRAYGNSIVAPLAAEFIRVVMKTMEGIRHA